jgi:hypothetical protein
LIQWTTPPTVIDIRKHPETYPCHDENRVRLAGEIVKRKNAASAPPSPKHVLYTPFCFHEAQTNDTETLINVIKACPIPAEREWADSLDLDSLRLHAVAILDSALKRAEQEWRLQEMPEPTPANLERIGNGAASVIVKLTLAHLAVLRKLCDNCHPTAIQSMDAILREAVRKLNEHALLYPALYAPRACQYPDWPILFSLHSEFRTDTVKLSEALGIGANYSLEIMGKGKQRKKPISFATPSNNLARRVFLTLWENRQKWHPKVHGKAFAQDADLPQWVRKCKDLPEFSAASVAQWLKIGWLSVKHAYGGQPESDPELWKIGKHRAIKAPPGSKSEAAHVRAGIREELGKALKKLARNPSSAV